MARGTGLRGPHGLAPASHLMAVSVATLATSSGIYLLTWLGHLYGPDPLAGFLTRDVVALPSSKSLVLHCLLACISSA